MPNSEPPKKEEVTLEESMAVMRSLLENPASQVILQHPVIKQMMELDLWGKENGLDSDKRANLVKTISTFLVDAPDLDTGKAYVQKVAEIIAEMGPALVGALEAFDPALLGPVEKVAKSEPPTS